MTARAAPISLDVLIIGGGIGGLWILSRAVKAGYNAVLLERDTLGGKQSVHAQGIIHSGTKYALQGAFTRGSRAIAAMPNRWRACLSGTGELDLGAAKTLSEATYFWSLGSLRARMTSFLASKALRQSVASVEPSLRPALFTADRYQGPLYRVDEPVLDVPSIIDALAAPLRNRIVQADATTASYSFSPDGMSTVSLPALDLVLQPARIVISAGEGYPAIAERMMLFLPTMQRRPLHMVAVKHRSDAPVFGHCIGSGATPVVTITTHRTPDGERVWYLGGQLAESGVTRDSGEQIAAAQQMLREVLPGIALDSARWATLRIDRAEPQTTGLVRPDHAFAEASGPVVAAWPTKLALSPDLADRVLALLPPPRAEVGDIAALARLPKPSIGRPFWDAL